MERNRNLICITGGAGCIGSSLVTELNARAIDSIVVIDDIGSTEKWKNLVGKRFLDIVSIHESLAWVVSHLQEISAIVHLGACSDTMETNGDYLLDNNYRYSLRLAEAALSAQVRFVYASSAATYGLGEWGFADDHAKLHQLRPLNMYGYSKHLFDLWALERRVLDRILGLKFFNVFGPNEWHKGRMASAVLKMVPEAQKNGVIHLFKSKNPLYADGEQNRDFIYIKDCVAIVSDLLFEPIYGILNVGSGSAFSWNRLARAVFSSLSLPHHIEYIPMPESLVGRYQYHTQAETARLQMALGRPPCRFSLEEAVRDYVIGHLLPEKTW